jgi:hypothetical protein
LRGRAEFISAAQKIYYFVLYRDRIDIFSGKGHGPASGDATAAPDAVVYQSVCGIFIIIGKFHNSSIQVVSNLRLLQGSIMKFCRMRQGDASVPVTQAKNCHSGGLSSSVG